MVVIIRVFDTTIMALILLFALIHLGVSIAIIIPFRKYGDFFSPQIGLSAFNIVIAFLALITGIFGIIAVWHSGRRLGKVICLLAVLLGICALASLVTAIIINAKSLDYISSRFSRYILVYRYSGDASNKIDLLQIKYECCGTDMWIDWKHGALNATSPAMNMTYTTIATTILSNNITSMMGTSTLTTGNLATTGNPTTTGNPATTGNPTTTRNPATAPVTVDKKFRRDMPHISDEFHHRQVRHWADYSRKKRQEPSTYGGIEDLPLTFGVTLPKSCCTTEALLTSNGSDAYCISNANNAVNHFYMKGCAKSIDIAAGNQAMGFGVINSFMVVLAFLAVPVLLGKPSEPI